MIRIGQSILLRIVFRNVQHIDGSMHHVTNDARRQTVSAEHCLPLFPDILVLRSYNPS